MVKKIWLWLERIIMLSLEKYNKRLNKKNINIIMNIMNRFKNIKKEINKNIYFRMLKKKKKWFKEN